MATINEAKTVTRLSDVVESYLGQNNNSEAYEDTAERLRGRGEVDDADIMDYAAQKWAALEAPGGNT